MKNNQQQKINYSFLKILTGSDLSQRRLPIMKIKSKNQGPIVWLTGCAHGDEVGGTVVIQEVFKKLKREPLLCGSVFALPMMNPLGFETASRYITLSDEDLNRSYPGDKDGSLAERLAHTIFSQIISTKPTVVLDLHNDWINSVHHILIDPKSLVQSAKVYKKTKMLAKEMGFLVIQEPEDIKTVEVSKKSLSGNLIQHNIPALTLELGEAYLVSEKNVEDGTRAIWRMLAHLKMVKPDNGSLNYEPPAVFRNKQLNYFQQSAGSSGIVRFLVKPGDQVEKGQPLARVYNAFGRLQENILAVNNGIVLGHYDYAVTFPGIDIFALAALN